MNLDITFAVIAGMLFGICAVVFGFLVGYHHGYHNALRDMSENNR